MGRACRHTSKCQTDNEKLTLSSERRGELHRGGGAERRVRVGVGAAAAQRRGERGAVLLVVVVTEEGRGISR